MKMIALAALASLAIPQAIVRDRTPGAPARPLEIVPRKAVLPGRPSERLPIIAGFRCKNFVGYTEQQMQANLYNGEVACSGEELDPGTGGYREVNVFPTPAGDVPVIVFSPQRNIASAKGSVIVLLGGPRLPMLGSTNLVSGLVKAGFAVFVPIYRGEWETDLSRPDLPVAISQVQALSRWADKRLTATLGISAGGYLAAAACQQGCHTPLLLLAPLIASPQQQFRSHPVSDKQPEARICLWKVGSDQQACDTRSNYFLSFWGARYWRRDLASLIGTGSGCANVRVVVSQQDERVYDPKAIARLRSRGCGVDEFTGYRHEQVDEAPALVAHTIELVRSAAIGTGGQTRQN
jgi:acetyl esterase/lipase